DNEVEVGLFQRWVLTIHENIRKLPDGQMLDTHLRVVQCLDIEDVIPNLRSFQDDRKIKSWIPPLVGVRWVDLRSVCHLILIHQILCGHRQSSTSTCEIREQIDETRSRPLRIRS